MFFSIMNSVGIENNYERFCDDDANKWLGSGTILLADDEESLRIIGVNMLEIMGFKVLLAADGKEAVELYGQKRKEIDLVILDLNMPNLDGSQAFYELRRINPDVEVILASGSSEEDISTRFAGKKLSGVLYKPYTMNILKETLFPLFGNS